MGCAICERQGKVIYEDNEIVAILLNKAVKEAQITIAPKNHIQAISQVDDEIIAKIYLISRKIMNVFPLLNKTAFNIIANNRPEEEFHFSLNLIPREENDGLNLQWQQKQLAQEQIDQIAKALSEMPISIVAKKQEPIVEEAAKEIDDNKDNYLLRQLDRQP
jgi:histidine triad (HIT) family protein